MKRIYTTLEEKLEDELKDFEEHWLQVCKELETVEMSKNDVLNWEAKFQVDRGKYLVYNLSHPSLVRLDIAERLNKIKHKLDIALQKAQAIEKKRKATSEKLGFIKSLTDPATIAAFIGFLSVEIGTYFYPISYNHIIGVVIAIIVFMIVAIINK